MSFCGSGLARDADNSVLQAGAVMPSRASPLPQGRGEQVAGQKNAPNQSGRHGHGIAFVLYRLGNGRGSIISGTVLLL